MTDNLFEEVIIKFNKLPAKNQRQVAEKLLAEIEDKLEDIDLESGHWDYRIVQKGHGDGTTYHIHEVSYSSSNKIRNWTQDPVEPMGESLHELRSDLHYMLSDAFRKPVLTEKDVNGKSQLVPAREFGEINGGHYFEYMDRVSVCLEHFDGFVRQHPVVGQHPHLKGICERTIDHLVKLYQACSKLAFELEGDDLKK